MNEITCTTHHCPVSAPRTHVVAESERVKLTIHPDMVRRGMWNTDCCAQYAIAMDADNGDLVWYRSADWRTYAMHYGWSRVASIAPSMACDRAANR